MMERSTLVLIVGQVVCLAIAGVSLWVAFGPPSVDDLRRSRFYVDGAAVATVLKMGGSASRKYDTCEEGFAEIYRNPRAPEWSKPRGDTDREAFMLGCMEGRR